MAGRDIKPKLFSLKCVVPFVVLCALRDLLPE